MTIRLPALLLALLTTFSALDARSATAPAAAPAWVPIREALGKGDTEAAVTAADAALKSAPRDAEALLWAGRAYGQSAMSASVFKRMSWAKKCREAWERAVAVDPESLEARRELLRYYLVAPGIAGGSVEKARAQAAGIARIDATQGHIADGMVAEDEKMPSEAEAAYRKAAGSGAKGVEGPVALASFLARQKRWPEARAVFEKRLAADPNDAFAVYQLGRISLLSGEEMEKGVALFDRFLALDAPKDGPSHADARWRKGLLLEKLGRTPAAIAEYRAALRTDPGHRGAKRELERLKEA